MGMTKRYTTRITLETEKAIKEMMEKYPNDYPTTSQLFRAAVFTLSRWKKKRAADSLDDITKWINENLPERGVNRLE